MLPKCSCAFAHALPRCTGGVGGVGGHNNVPANFKTKVRKTMRCHIAAGGGIVTSLPASIVRYVRRCTEDA